MLNEGGRGEGQLYSVADSKTGLTYQYSYDSQGRLMSSSVTDVSDPNNPVKVITTRQTYDANNQLSAQYWQLGSTQYSETYTYSKTTGLLATHKPAVGNTLTYGYDTLQRLSTVTGGIYGKTYTYRDISGTDKTTTQVASLTYDLPTAITYGYTYDALGNIATYTEAGTTYTYTYDAQNQLTKQTGGGKTHTYTYDAAGNILSASNGTTTHSYTYGNSVWKDLLTKFDGYTITYDASGNPTDYYNGTEWDMTWAEGRRLVSASGDGKNLTFTYDSDGLRLTKKVGSTTYNYYYAGGKLLRQTGGGNTLDFFYDASGNPYALKYNNTLYYYITNLQGDVLHIVNTSGTPVVSYSYSPYGEPTTVKPATTNDALAAANPLRYRGYVYDTETDLYYLQSRYYDPEVGRFINADGYVSTGQGILGCNMFAYCNNNPVSRVDNSGTTTETVQAWVQTMWWVCLVDLYLPFGDLIFTIGFVALLAKTYNISYDQASKLRETSVAAASAFLDYASTAATPPPPNKGGKGTQVTSKTLYKKHGKNGFRIDVENPGNRDGQIHLQKGSSKYIYNTADQTFRIGSSSGPLAPQSIQDLLTLEEVIIAIAKGLKILGY